MKNKSLFLVTSFVAIFSNFGGAHADAILRTVKQIQNSEVHILTLGENETLSPPPLSIDVPAVWVLPTLSTETAEYVQEKVEIKQYASELVSVFGEMAKESWPKGVNEDKWLKVFREVILVVATNSAGEILRSGLITQNNPVSGEFGVYEAAVNRIAQISSTPLTKIQFFHTHPPDNNNLSTPAGDLEAALLYFARLPATVTELQQTILPWTTAYKAAFSQMVFIDIGGGKKKHVDEPVPIATPFAVRVVLKR